MNAPRRILVADDDPVIRRLLTDLLASCGYAVSTASDGRSTLDAAADATFDLILLDYTLPDQTGFDVLSRLRQRPGTHGTPVLMVTGDDRESLESRAGAPSCQGYLEKPFSGRTLLSAVRTTLAG